MRGKCSLFENRAIANVNFVKHLAMKKLRKNLHVICVMQIMLVIQH